MTDLAAWLLDCIAEDEAAARACVGPEWQNGLPATIHPNPETYRTVVRSLGHVCGSIIAADAIHIARWDPARVLAECEAKRRIVKAYEFETDTPPDGTDQPPAMALRLLALPYSDRDGYDPAWAPE